ncbi:Cullin-1, partial [Cichlidogyrus casuarinus]
RGNQPSPSTPTVSQPWNGAGNMPVTPASVSGLVQEPRIDLSTYQNHVEQPFLNETDTFYMLESRQFLQVNHVTDYLKKIEARMNEERARVKNYLHISSEPKLLRSCEQYLIGDHIEKLTGEFCTLLNEHREEDIWRMYQLVGRFPRGMKALVNIMEEHVKDKGLEALKAVAKNAVSDPKLYIDTIMNIQRKYYNLVVSACNSDPAFHQALDKGCERFINNNAVIEITKNKRKTPELLAKYIDISLKKSPKNGTLDDLEDTLQRVMELFKYVEEKDIFLNFYSKFMARRFVSNQSVSEELESAMISKLKESQGFEYTNNLQRLFCEVNYSKELKTRFLDSLKTDHPEGSSFDFGVTVLASIAWPFNLQASFNIPPELEHCYNQFSNFYATVHSGRKLTWCYHHSRGELSAHFSKERYTFQVSTYQMAVLLMFNDQLSNSMETIRCQTGIEPGILTQVLQILVKARILRMKENSQGSETEPMGVLSETNEATGSTSISPETVFHLCVDYKNKRLRVNLNTQLKSEVKQEAEQTSIQVDDNRKYIIQACIVRVLKARKTIKHQQLVTEVISQMSSKFKPSIALIKQSITLLIDKSYIARSENERETYEYLV